MACSSSSSARDPVIRAVVFDFDGIVLDTETPVYVSWQEAFAAHGAELTLDEWLDEVGSSGVLDLVGMLHARAASAVDVDTMDATRRARRDELLAGEPVLPGVVRWLDDAEQAGLAIAIASSSQLDWVHGHLTRLGVRDRFGHMSCREENVPPKPAPDLYLRACAALAVEPNEALAVEDSANGVTAAKRAGLWCVAVPNRITAGLDFGAADLVVPSLAECPLTEALDRLGLAVPPPRPTKM
jgi:HAD superfamily hydrolase (TIGR01509 family)